MLHFIPTQSPERELISLFVITVGTLLNELMHSQAPYFIFEPGSQGSLVTREGGDYGEVVFAFHSLFISLEV